MTTHTFLIVAGEASGDMYGAEVARALHERFPGARLFGLGGGRMRAAGVELLADLGETAVVGPFEAVGHLGGLYRIFRRLVGEIEARRPAAAILIDYPDFNMRLAARAREFDVPVVYYISPQVWAWRPGRVKQLRGLVDKMLVVLPFEEAIYREAGVDVEFVGHPLVDMVRPAMDKAAFFAAYGLDPERPLVALLPGSRRKEIRYILPTLTEAAARMIRERPGLQFVLPVARGLSEDYVKSFLDAAVPVRLIPEHGYDAVRYARVAVVASGTATLETALLGTPQVIVYRIGRATWLLGRFLLKIRTFGLVNIILGEEAVPELYQHRMTPENIAGAVLALMDDAGRRSQMRGAYERMRRSLGEGGASGRVAAATAAVLNSRPRKTG